MSGEPDVVVVGGGLGAVRTAQTLRDLGHRGGIRILSAEPEHPYDRPPLSKGHLAGAVPPDALALLPPDGYAALDITLDLGREVVGLDPEAGCVVTVDGAEIPFDRLVVATGARARTLPVFANRPQAFALRTAADSRRLAAAVRGRGRIAVVGGGFIGLEVAATARTAGCPVTVIEAQPAPLLAAVGPDIALWLQERHAARGVGFRCAVTVASSGPAADGGERLVLSDGSVVEADAVVVGVGVVRDVGWLEAAGLEVARGLVCDENGRTNLPGVVGVGDVVCRCTPAGGLEPLAHWTAAGTSARRAAHALLDLEVPDLPDDRYFWSDQFGLRLQCAGVADADSELVVVAGDLATDAFVVQFRSQDRTTGVLGVNEPRAFLRHRRDLRRAMEPVR